MNRTGHHVLLPVLKILAKPYKEGVDDFMLAIKVGQAARPLKGQACGAGYLTDPLSGQLHKAAIKCAAKRPEAGLRLRAPARLVPTVLASS